MNESVDFAITDVREKLRQAALPLQALGHPMFPSRPGELGVEEQKIADLAVEGTVVAHYLGERRVHLGRQDIVWIKGPERSQVEAFIFRMSFIRELACAWQVSGNAEYARAARDYLEEFMKAWPREHTGESNDVDNTLTLGIRNLFWCKSLPLLLDSPCFDDGFLLLLLDYMSTQFQFLRRNVKSLINWRIFNARDLLAGSLYLSFLEPAAEWREYAVMVLNDGWLRQFLADGAHCEVNPVYHRGMVETFQNLVSLNRLCPQLGLNMTLKRLRELYNFSLACVKPNGYMCGIHDSQSEFTGHRRDNIHTTSHKGVDNLAAWDKFRHEYGLPLEYPPTSQVFPDAGLAFLRTGWDEDAAWMSFDATQWGSGHCHLSRNAVQLHAFRQSMVIDPGWLSYEMNEWGVYGRSTPAHSTCNLNRLSQSATNPSRLRAYRAPGYDAVHSVYEGGYWDTELNWNFTHAAKGIWAQHTRILFWVQERFAFVADSMYRLPETPDNPPLTRPDFECVWQLAPGAEINLQPERDRAVACWRDAGLLLLTPIRPQNSEYRIHCGETEPLRGWVPGEGEHIPAPQVVLNTPRMEKQHEYYVTVLVPFRGGSAPEVQVEAKSPKGQIGYVNLHWPDGSRDAVHWGCSLNLMLGKNAEFATDSSLVHLHYGKDGRAESGCCVNGTFLKPFVNQVRERPETFTFKCQ